MTDTASVWLSSEQKSKLALPALKPNTKSAILMRPTAYHMQGLVYHSNYIKPDLKLKERTSSNVIWVASFEH